MKKPVIFLALFLGMGLFATGQDKKLTIVAFGDSTTAPRPDAVEQVYADRLPALLAPLGRTVRVINSGVVCSHTGAAKSTDTIKVAHARDRFASGVLAHDPDLVLIQFGLNDAFPDTKGEMNPDFRSPTGWPATIPLTKYRDNLAFFIERLRGRGIGVILMTPNPCHTSTAKWLQERTAEYAGAARVVAREKSVPLVDVWQAHLDYAKTPGANRDALLLDICHPTDRAHALVAELLSRQIAKMYMETKPDPRRGYTIPLIDLAGEKHRQVIVDREANQYLGHPTTVLLDDKKTMLCVYPKGHGRGAIIMKRSLDGGLTWSPRLPVPENWATSKETPTIHQVSTAKGKKRLLLFSGLYPIRMAHSEDLGATWSPLKKIGDFGGIVAMGALIAMPSRAGSYLAFFHDDGRFIREHGKRSRFYVYKTLSPDGGLTWGRPEIVATHPRAHLCEPGIIRSPDGKELAMLLRENSRKLNSFVCFSRDEGITWSAPRQLPGALTGDRHTGVYAPDGRLFISFRDTTHHSQTQGDWVGWVGRYEDIANNKEGQYRIRIMDNHHRWDCAYPGVEILPDGTIVTTTYGYWSKGEKPYIVSVRCNLTELDKRAKRQK